MKHWITVLLCLGTGISLINGQNVNDVDEDYEVKRFHVQSRALNGSPTCVVTRRKRSAQSSGEGEEFYDDTRSTDTEDEEDDPVDEDMEMGVSTGVGKQESSGMLIRNSDLNENAGILVIQNGVSPDSPVLFELRPVEADERDTYFEMDDENNPDPLKDEEYEDNSGGMDIVDNRYQPISTLNSYDSDDYVEPTPIKRRVRPTQKPKRKPSSQWDVANSDDHRIKPKKKPRRPLNSPPRKPNRRTNQNKKPNMNQTKNKKRNKNKRKNDNRKRVSSGSQDTQKNIRKQNLKGGVTNSFNKNNRFGFNVNQGSGSKTVTNTMTTTQTGTANDQQDVNCIIIDKTPTPTTEKPFWDILGRSAADRQTDRSFGLRKRFKHKLLG